MWHFGKETITSPVKFQKWERYLHKRSECVAIDTFTAAVNVPMLNRSLALPRLVSSPISAVFVENLSLRVVLELVETKQQAR